MAANGILNEEGPAPLADVCDVEVAAEKKGIFIHSHEVSSEKERCLECNHICFANEEDFENSVNQGFAVLDHAAMKVKVRLAGQVAVYELKSDACECTRS